MDHCHLLISSLSNMLMVLSIVQPNKWHTPVLPLLSHNTHTCFEINRLQTAHSVCGGKAQQQARQVLEKLLDSIKLIKNSQIINQLMSKSPITLLFKLLDRRYIRLTLRATIFPVINITTCTVSKITKATVSCSVSTGLKAKTVN